MTTLDVCLGCPESRRGVTSNGKAACAADAERRDVMTLATLATCPLGKFAGAAPYRQQPPATVPVAAVSVDQWPAAVKRLALRRQPGDKGVGDTLARVLGAAGTAYKAFWRMLGTPCGCEDRQRWLNDRYPYGWPTALPSSPQTP